MIRLIARWQTGQKQSALFVCIRQSGTGRYPLYDLPSSPHPESTRQAEQALGRSLRSLARAAGQAYPPAAVRARDFTLRHTKPYLESYI